MGRIKLTKFTIDIDDSDLKHDLIILLCNVAGNGINKPIKEYYETLVLVLWNADLKNKEKVKK